MSAHVTSSFDASINSFDMYIATTEIETSIYNLKRKTSLKWVNFELFKPEKNNIIM